jgi:hypothetical protein
MEHADDQGLLATGVVALMALDASLALTRLPAEVRRVLRAVPDPVRLGVPAESPRMERDAS